MYVDKNGKKLSNPNSYHIQYYILEEPNDWNQEMVGRIKWDAGARANHGFWFYPENKLLEPTHTRFKLPFEMIMKSPRILKCHQIRRIT